ncbi:hypothetical protein TGRH88_066560 [Toxoplasma gondii]|uniref:Uncharacterized protein n=1 Tax=Toxoplasma gondii TaxID=5811 RepID=A0A7J6JXL9_TOXGO|nr:hypothetical protein TGRH88_066560 [Toxoplasma gondii]
MNSHLLDQNWKKKATFTLREVLVMDSNSVLGAFAPKGITCKLRLLQPEMDAYLRICRPGKMDRCLESYMFYSSTRVHYKRQPNRMAFFENCSVPACCGAKALPSPNILLGQRLHLMHYLR